MQGVQTILSKLALNKAEIEVYLQLLETPDLQITDLAKKTPYHRPRIMEILESLEANKLITVNKVGKRNVYRAASPHNLVDRAKAALTDVQAVLPSLLDKQNEQKTDGFTTLTGESGLASCFLDMVVSLNKDDAFYRISSASDQQFVDSIVPKEYRPLRDAKNLERKVITSHYVGKQKKNRLERSIRYFDEADELFEHNVIQFIYGDKVSLLDFNTLTATIIHNKAIASFQKSMFLTLYKRLDRQTHS